MKLQFNLFLNPIQPLWTVQPFREYYNLPSYIFLANTTSKPQVQQLPFLPYLVSTNFSLPRLLDLSTPDLTTAALGVTAGRARGALQIILAATLHMSVVW